MWNKRREEEPARPVPQGPSAPPAAPSFAEPKKEAPTMSSMPSGRFEPESRGSGSSATIGKAV